MSVRRVFVLLGPMSVLGVQVMNIDWETQQKNVDICSTHGCYAVERWRLCLRLPHSCPTVDW